MIAPGIDTNLLIDRNFTKAISEYGYDRYRFDGDGMFVQCRLWKSGEYVASIEVESTDILLAAHYALRSALALAETNVSDGAK